MLSAEAVRLYLNVRLTLQRHVCFMSVFKIYETLFPPWFSGSSLLGPVIASQEHKSIESTMLYVSLADFGNDEYTTKVSKSVRED